MVAWRPFLAIRGRFRGRAVAGLPEARPDCRKLSVTAGAYRRSARPPSPRRHGMAREPGKRSCGDHSNRFGPAEDPTIAANSFGRAEARRGTANRGSGSADGPMRTATRVRSRSRDVPADTRPGPPGRVRRAVARSRRRWPARRGVARTGARRRSRRAPRSPRRRGSRPRAGRTRGPAPTAPRARRSGV